MATLWLVTACGARSASVPATSGAGEPARVAGGSPAPLGASPGAAPERLLEALQQPWSAFARPLGPHRVRLHARSLRSGPGLPMARVEQHVDLVWGAGGRLWVRKDTHDQYGLELRWIDDWLYLRQRWNRFIRRRALDRQEPLRLADCAYGLLPDELALLGRFLKLGPARAVTVLGRAAWQVSLLRAERAGELAPGEQQALEAQSARRWRRSLQVEELSGTAAIDRLTGAPLLARVRARCSFTLPAGPSDATGIPRLASPGGARGQLELELEQRVIDLGEAIGIAAPPADEVVAEVRGRRLEIERQMVLGERPVDPAWRQLSP